MLLDTMYSMHSRTMVALALCSASRWCENKEHPLLLDKEMSLTKAQPYPVKIQLCSQKCLKKCTVELHAQFTSDLLIHCTSTYNEMPLTSHLTVLPALPRVLGPRGMCSSSCASKSGEGSESKAAFDSTHSNLYRVATGANLERKQLSGNNLLVIRSHRSNLVRAVSGMSPLWCLGEKKKKL